MIDQVQNSDSQGEEYIGQASLNFGEEQFRGDTVQSWSISEQLEENQVVTKASAIVHPPKDSRWDYHAETELNGPQGLIHRGICVKAEFHPDGGIEFSFSGLSWEFEHVDVRKISIFGMSDLETAYWIPLLTGLVSGVEIPGLILNKELRPFLYAVPLKGLSAKGEVESISFRDFGVTSGSDDQIFGPLLAKLEKMASEPDLQVDIPKAWGVVLARDFLEADRLALERARFTADLINFALSAGVSHFDTRFDSDTFEWNAGIGRSVVALGPWIVLREVETTKGWVRSVPLLERRFETDVEESHNRIAFFAQKFLDASKLGDIEDQSGRRALSERETKLSIGIQRSLRWLGIASSEDSVGDQFIATWISLEAILNSIDYPGVFEGDRLDARRIVRQSIRGMDLPEPGKDSQLSIDREFISNRVLNNQWPLRTKLVLFAKSCGVELRSDDSELVGSLAKMRNSVFHTGNDEPPIPRQELRRLRYLVERLIIAASVYGYEDLEDETLHQLHFGELGPEGGSAPLFLDGRKVPYKLVIDNHSDQQIFEFVIEGKVYNDRNANLS